MKALVLISSAIVIFISDFYRKKNNISLFEYPILMLFAILGMLIMISSNDLIILYISLELQSLSLYVLVAIKRDSSKAAEAGLKYFILGSLASAIILYGFSLIYANTGYTNFNDISKAIENFAELPIGLILGIIFTLSGMAFKLSAAPFHMWTPDVYEGSPSSVTTFLVAAPKIAAITIIIRLVNEPFIGALYVWQQILIAIAILSMAIGAFTALKQNNLKRLLAYSTIGNIGYILIGVIASSEFGIIASVLFISLYVVMSLGAFAFIMSLRREDEQIINIDSLSGFSKSHPLIAVLISIILLSMAGLPPLGGFVGKLYVFLAAIESGLTYLAFIGVIFSVVSAYYYLKIIKVMYFDELSESLSLVIDKKLLATMVLSALFMLTFLFFAKNIIGMISNSVSSIV